MKNYCVNNGKDHIHNFTVKRCVYLDIGSMEAAARYNRFECSLCLEAFKDPRILPCFHTFCLICLKDYLSSIPKDNGTSSQFNCPLCRKVNSLPQDGVQGLQKNFYLNESDEKIKGKVQSCPDHPEEDLRFFCHNCNDSLCRDCKVIKHEGHKVEMLKNVIENMKKEIEKTLDDTEVAINDSESILVTKLETDIESLETALRVIKETSEQMNKDIDETFSMVNSLISPRLDIWNVKTEIVQTQSRGRHLTLMDLKDSFAEAIDKNDNELLFKLFKDLVQDGGEIRRLSARDSLLPFSSELSDADKMYIDIDLRKLSAFFFDFRDAVQKGLADFKKIFETCKISTDNEDVEMALEKIDGDSKVNLHDK